MVRRKKNYSLIFENKKLNSLEIPKFKTWFFFELKIILFFYSRLKIGKDIFLVNFSKASRNIEMFKLKCRIEKCHTEGKLWTITSKLMACTNERSVETRELALQSVFLFIPIRFPVLEIPSCKQTETY